MKKFRQLLLFLVLAAVVALLFRSGGGSHGPNRSKGAGPAAPEPPPVDLSLRKVVYTEMENGVMKWKLEAEKGDVSRGAGRVLLTTAHLVTSPAVPAKRVVIDAGNADYDMNRREMQLSGGVRVTTASGITFTTGTAKFVGPKSLITTTD
ncbi:MAG TPA: LPS export ABC transporter periplasmic protein LptC, partial [Verrucomicrobiae bacterium]|nr:LPS export ABC transporter periplasmic protein LptC [Verrucomicrobiae bacterium]